MRIVLSRKKKSDAVLSNEEVLFTCKGTTNPGNIVAYVQNEISTLSPSEMGKQLETPETHTGSALKSEKHFGSSKRTQDRRQRSLRVPALEQRPTGTGGEEKTKKNI